MTPQFTAISNVWSDRLGNFKNNSMPRCQLEHLRRSVDCLNSASSDSGPQSDKTAALIWIDSLCVPIDTEYRDIAIQRMAATYESAARVLVLDSELQEIPLPSTPEEIIMRFSCSWWIRRLWTLQEAALARKLCVQFKDEAVERAHLLTQLRDSKFTDERIFSKTSRDVFVWIENFMAFKEATPETKIKYALRDVGWRSTSSKGDESIVLATLLGQDTTNLLKSKVQNRMKLFYSMFGRFPQDNIFAESDRLSDRGFGSALTSSLRIGALGRISLMGNISDTGLLVTFQGYVLDSPLDIIQEDFYLVDPSNKVHHAVFPDLQTRLPRENYSAGIQHIGMVMDRNPSTHGVYRVVLVLVQRIEEGVYFVDHLCRATAQPPLAHSVDKLRRMEQDAKLPSLSAITRNRGSDASEVREGLRARHEELGERRIVIGKSTAPNQKWCIG